MVEIVSLIFGVFLVALVVRVAMEGIAAALEVLLRLFPSKR